MLHYWRKVWTLIVKKGWICFNMSSLFAVSLSEDPKNEVKAHGLYSKNEVRLYSIRDHSCAAARFWFKMSYFPESFVVALSLSTSSPIRSQEHFTSSKVPKNVWGKKLNKKLRFPKHPFYYTLWNKKCHLLIYSCRIGYFEIARLVC